MNTNVARNSTKVDPDIVSNTAIVFYVLVFTVCSVAIFLEHHCDRHHCEMISKSATMSIEQVSLLAPCFANLQLVKW